MAPGGSEGEEGEDREAKRRRVGGDQAEDDSGRLLGDDEGDGEYWDALFDGRVREDDASHEGVPLVGGEQAREAPAFGDHDLQRGAGPGGVPGVPAPLCCA